MNHFACVLVNTAVFFFLGKKTLQIQTLAPCCRFGVKGTLLGSALLPSRLSLCRSPPLASFLSPSARCCCVAEFLRFTPLVPLLPGDGVGGERGFLLFSSHNG